METKSLVKFYIALQLLSFFQMFQLKRLNGDFFYEDFELIPAFIALITSVVIFILFLLLINHTKIKFKKVQDNFLFDKKIIIFLLFLNIAFAYYLGIGLYSSQEIYSVPLILKPFVILINRIDVYILCAALVINSNSSKLLIYFSLILLSVYSLSKGSLFFVLFILILLILSNRVKINIRTIVIFICLFFFSLSSVIKIYEWREIRRKGESIDYVSLIGENELNNYFASRVIGRLSSLSATTYFLKNVEKIKKSQSRLSKFEFFLEFTRPIYGGIIRNNKRGFTPYLTSIYDDSAGTEYGLMYGLPIVILLSYFQGIHVLIFNIFLLILTVYTIVKISLLIFGEKGKVISLLILYYPLNSGVPSEFMQILISLLVILILDMIVKMILKTKLNNDYSN